MRIAQIAPLHEAVPPKLYGGTERVVSYLTEELVALGHDVTLFASGDSLTSARLAPMSKQALRLDPGVRDTLAPHLRMLELILRRADEFDVMHLHVDYLPFSAFSRQPTPFLTTLHGRLDLQEYVDIFNIFPRVPVVSISDSQRLPVPDLNWLGTVQHGLPLDLLMPQPVKPEYLAFLGRISPEKGVDKAIRIAGRAGMKLKIAAKVDRLDADYFNEQIKPLFAAPHVEYIGEINEDQKPEFLSGAAALMFPIDWPEPFGLVMIEAMACGTPVIAYNRGAVPEVLEDGLTGAIVGSETEALRAVKRLHVFDRAAIRRRFEERFTARRMAEEYLEVYGRLLLAGRPQLRAVNA